MAVERSLKSFFQFFGVGEYPPEYNPRIHGPYDPSRNYGKGKLISFVCVVIVTARSGCRQYVNMEAENGTLEENGYQLEIRTF